jgi:phosphoribosylformylglycinamidine synthase
MLGICNGFQVMVKTGILPDLSFQQKVTLTFNDSARFEDRWVYLRLNRLGTKIKEKNKNRKKPENIWTKGLPQIISLPIAHGEGKFAASKKVLADIEKNEQVVFRYCDVKGKSAGYPFNPNGAINDIAGITDATGKILAMMPHPERCMFEHHVLFACGAKQEPWGRKIFANAVNYFQ